MDVGGDLIWGNDVNRKYSPNLRAKWCLLSSDILSIRNSRRVFQAGLSLAIMTYRQRPAKRSQIELRCANRYIRRYVGCGSVRRAPACHGAGRHCRELRGRRTAEPIAHLSWKLIQPICGITVARKQPFPVRNSRTSRPQHHGLFMPRSDQVPRGQEQDCRGPQVSNL